MIIITTCLWHHHRPPHSREVVLGKQEPMERYPWSWSQRWQGDCRLCCILNNRNDSFTPQNPRRPWDMEEVSTEEQKGSVEERPHLHNWLYPLALLHWKLFMPAMFFEFGFSTSLAMDESRFLVLTQKHGHVCPLPETEGLDLMYDFNMQYSPSALFSFFTPWPGNLRPFPISR